MLSTALAITSCSSGVPQAMSLWRFESMESFAPGTNGWSVATNVLAAAGVSAP